MTHSNYLSTSTTLVKNSGLKLVSDRLATLGRLIHASFFQARWLPIGLSALLLLVTFQASALELAEHPKLQAVADQLVEEKYYTQKQLRRLFSRVDFQQSVLDAMQNPAEYKFTWGKYRKLFLQADRIEQGVAFWQQYADELNRAQNQYGVPASVIVAIIGVESKFGKYKGKYKVLDSLATLVIGFERRSKFFAKELKEFLILTKENDLAAHKILGSYAGAVGYPQFISSSYRAYAVDFSGDGVIDLIDQPVDAIGSVANYFVKNGWLKHQPVTSAEHINVPAQVADLASRKRAVKYRALLLRQMGASIDRSVVDIEKLGVLMLDASEVATEDGVYFVRAGDTICQIADRYDIPCNALMKLNQLDKQGKIFRGQKLKLPENVQEGPKSKWQLAEGGSPISQESIDTPNSGVQPRYFYTHENFYVICSRIHLL